VAVRIIASAADGGPSGEAAHELLVRGAPGALDTSFAAAGIFALGAAPAEATGAVVLHDGRTLLGGRIGDEAVVVRLLADGALDPAFGDGGIARLGRVRSTHDVAAAGDAALLGGTTEASGFVARLDGSGAADPAFGASGFLATDPAEGRALAILGDGSVAVGGQGATGAHVLRRRGDGAFVAEWTGEGTLGAIARKGEDRLTICTSSGDGVRFHELAADAAPDPLYELATTPEVLARCTSIVNGTPLDFWAAGDRVRDGVREIAVVHLDVSPTGGPLKVDPYFAQPLPAGAAFGTAARVTIGGPGVILVAAELAPAGEPSRFALIRLSAYGPLDPTFGGGASWVATPIGTSAASPRAIAVGPDRRVVVAGTNGDMVAARYWQ
jgi:uncharacterized delta-60 repeat protein